MQTLKSNILYLNEYGIDVMMNIAGENDRHLEAVEQAFGVHLEIDQGILVADSDSRQEELKNLFAQLVEICRQKKHLDMADVSNVLHNTVDASFFRNVLITGVGNRSFYIRSQGQKALYEAFEKHDITIVTGPAGTGKTFLAAVYASNMLKKGSIKKIIVTRPVVEAGESLGFLPGDLKEKVDPYLRPIYDSFEAVFGSENVQRMVEKGIIEISPLAYMRGRTLNDAVVILDEAQNTTRMQMKMFLTRLGFNAKMIINGDITQIDLPSHKSSGLIAALQILKDIDEIAIVSMSNSDIVRHPIVQKIIEAYEKKEQI